MSNEGQVTVKQADRNAAQWLSDQRAKTIGEITRGLNMRDGHWDDQPEVQAFAHQRLHQFIRDRDVCAQVCRDHAKGQRSVGTKTAYHIARALDAAAKAILALTPSNRSDAVDGETALREALTELRDAVERHGDWDDGCFYYNRHAASELQGPLIRARAALSNTGTTNGGGK